MKDSIPQKEKSRIYISSRDLNYARHFINNDVEFCRNSTDVFPIHERIVLKKHSHKETEKMVSISVSYVYSRTDIL